MKNPMKDLGYCSECKNKNTEQCKTCHMEGSYENANASNFMEE